MTEALEQIQAAQPRRFRQYSKYRDSEVAWLGEIPSHWKVGRLRSTVTGCQNGTWGDEADGMHDVICVRVADFDRLRFGVNLDDPTLRSIEPKAAQARRLRKGDLLLEKSGGGEKQPVGAVVMYGHDEPAVCSNFVARVPVSDGHDPRFLTYLHATLYAARINTRSIKQSTGIQNLDSTSYLNEPVGLPGSEAQVSIASFLDHETEKIDDLVSRKRRLIELLQEKRTALITCAVTRGIDSSVSTKDAGVEWLGQIPAHWRVKKLSWLTKCLDSKRIPLNAEERGKMQGEFPYWGANSVVDHVDQWLFDEELVLLGEDGAPFFDRSRPVAFRVEGKIWVNNHAHVLRPQAELDAQFLAHVLNCVDYRAFIDGSTRDKLTQGDMKGIPIQCPDIDEQRAIVAALSQQTMKIDALIAKVRDAIDLLKEFRTALISAAVTGKIDAREEVQ